MTPPICPLFTVLTHSHVLHPLCSHWFSVSAGFTLMCVYCCPTGGMLFEGDPEGHEVSYWSFLVCWQLHQDGHFHCTPLFPLPHWGKILQVKTLIIPIFILFGHCCSIYLPTFFTLKYLNPLIWMSLYLYWHDVCDCINLGYMCTVQFCLIRSFKQMIIVTQCTTFPVNH